MSETPISRPAKRLRQDFESTPFERDDDLWFEDGSVVLVAQNVGFCVYRGVLATQSSVLSDILEAGKSQGEGYDGRPRMTVTDSPEDLRHFLRALFPETTRVQFSGLFGKHNDIVPVPSDELFAVIRLAHKYQVKDLLRQALDALQNRYSDYYWGCSSRWLDQNVAVVNIARLADRPMILPLALYRCYLLGSEVFDGYKRSDGPVEHLNDADLRRCVDGGTRMMLARQETICSILARALNTSSRDASHSLDCARALCAKLKETAQEEPKRRDIFSFAPWKNWGKNPGICSSCRSEALYALEKMRDEIWKKLPEYFDVEVEGWRSL